MGHRDPLPRSFSSVRLRVQMPQKIREPPAFLIRIRLEHFEIAHLLQSEVAEISTQLAPCAERPARAPVRERERPDAALGVGYVRVGVRVANSLQPEGQRISLREAFNGQSGNLGALRECPDIGEGGAKLDFSRTRKMRWRSLMRFPEVIFAYPKIWEVGPKTRCSRFRQTGNQVCQPKRYQMTVLT
ncbi:hypothetical protein OKW45_006114 [Paraburkholderia sp. WSM4175]